MGGNLNKKLIQEQIFNNKSVQKMVREIVAQEIEKEKVLFKEEFESHPVTQELEGGSSASNMSGTLGGYGNLFSFLGFNNGANPTIPVKMLIQKIVLDRKVGSNKNSFILKVNVPSKDEFGNITRLPWESGRSWLLDMERGISGLGAYLYGRFIDSRSGTGLQSKYNYSNRIFRPVKYFSDIYERFIRRLEKI